MKTVLITGIGRGIGRALAEKFLNEDWYVVGTSTEGTIEYSNKNLEVFKLDLSDSNSIKDCVAGIASLNKEIDILINNAGVLLDDEETRVITEKLRETLEVNLIGTIDFTEKIIPLLENNAHIVNISSSAGSLEDTENVEDSHSPYHYPAYKISKAALNMYTRTLAVRLKHENMNILVSSVHPGWVKTDMGGTDAPTLPADAALNIFDLATSRPQTGQFWFNGKKYPW